MLRLLAELLELEPLQVDLFEAPHAGIILQGAFIGALGDLR